MVLFYSLFQCKDQNEIVNFTGLRSIDIEKPNDVNEIQKKDLMAALISSDQELQKELLPLQQAIQSGKVISPFSFFLKKNHFRLILFFIYLFLISFLIYNRKWMNLLNI